MSGADALFGGVIFAWAILTTVGLFLALDAVAALRDRHIRRGLKRRKR